MNGFKFFLAVVAASALFGSAAAGASADVIRSGNTFTASPSICSCWSTQDGYQVYGLPYYYDLASMQANPTDWTKWTVAPVNAVGIFDALRADPGYKPLPPVTSGSVEVEVGGTVEESSGDDPPADEDSDSRSSRGKQSVRVG